MLGQRKRFFQKRTYESVTKMPNKAGNSKGSANPDSSLNNSAAHYFQGFK